MNSRTDFKAGQEVPADGAFLTEPQAIRPDLADCQAIARDKYTLEWGVRETDSALVLHLFPHIEGDNFAKEWDPDYAMDKRLDYAIPQLFDTTMVNAGFEPEYNSFYIIVRAILAPDLRLLIHRFLELIEGAPLSH